MRRRGLRIHSCSCGGIHRSLSHIVRLTPSFICTCCGQNGVLTIVGSCQTTLMSCGGTVRLSPHFTSTCCGHKLAGVFLKGGHRNVRSLDGTNRLKVFSTCGVVGQFAAVRRGWLSTVFFFGWGICVFTSRW